MALKILVVEDDVHISKLLIEFLTRSGFKTESANSAEEAEAILKHEEINAVLTDIKLPGTDGIKFTKNIKKKYNLDVIAMTAYSSEYSYEDAIKNGASDLIFKPVPCPQTGVGYSRQLQTGYRTGWRREPMVAAIAIRIVRT